MTDKITTVPDAQNSIFKSDPAAPVNIGYLVQARLCHEDQCMQGEFRLSPFHRTFPIPPLQGFAL